MSPPVKWLLVEALLPLFGASLIFVLVGFGRSQTFQPANPGDKFKWAWTEAADAMGWIYGGAVLGIQAGLKAEAGPVYLAASGAVWTCFVATFGCGILLLCALISRGEDPKWKPPKRMLMSSGAMIIMIIGAGWRIQKSAFEFGS